MRLCDARFSLACFLVWCLGLTQSAMAQLGGEITGYAPQRAGMAGAGAAAATSGLDLVNNPASLGFLPRRDGNATTRLEMAGRLMLNPLEIQTADGIEYSPGGTTAVAPFLSWSTGAGNAWSWGVAVVPTAGGGASYQRTVDLNVATNSTSPPFIPLQSNIPIETQVVQLGLEPALAWRASKSWSFGFGASIRYTRLDFTSAADIPFSDLQGEFGPGQSWGDIFLDLLDQGGRGDVTGLQAEVDASADALPHLALKMSFLWEPRLGRRLTGWVRSPTTARDLEGNVVVDLSEDFGAVLNGLYGFDSVDQFRLRVPGVRFPAQIGLAWMETLGRSDRFFMDAAWTNWANAFHGWIAEVDQGEGDLGEIAGDSPISVDLGIQWRDNVKLSLGWEHDLFRPLRMGSGNRASGSPWTVRGGLGWASNAVGGTPLPGLLPVQPLHFALGATRWGRRGSGDWHFSIVAAPPASYVSGINPQLSDLSGDAFRQSSLSFAAGWTVSF